VVAFVATLALIVLLTINGSVQYEVSDPSKLLVQFIDINSVTGSEAKMGDFIYDWLDHQGWTVQRQMVTSATFNIFATRGNPNPRLLLSSHFDTVPPFIPGYDDGTRVWGRGAVDAKGPIVSQLFAVTQMLAEGSLSPEDIGLLYVIQQETNSGGMKKANELGLTPQYLIMGEPTDLELGLGHKGELGFTAQSFGQESHSGYPQLGMSAITPLVSFMMDLELEPWPNDTYFGQTTMNIGTMRGGVAMNVVPASANISVAIRAAVPVETLKERVIQLAAPYNLTLAFPEQFDPFRCDLVPGFPTDLFAFGTDLPAFTAPNHKSYLFGPGSILVAHTDGEYLEKDLLLLSISEYKRLITAVLSQR